MSFAKRKSLSWRQNGKLARTRVPLGHPVHRVNERNPQIGVRLSDVPKRLRTAYCATCHGKQKMEFFHPVKRGDRYFFNGVCARCGNPVWRVLGKKDVEDLNATGSYSIGKNKGMNNDAN